MTTLEVLAVSPITLTIRQSGVQKELVGVPYHAHQPNRTGCPQNDKNELHCYKRL